MQLPLLFVKADLVSKTQTDDNNCLQLIPYKNTSICEMNRGWSQDIHKKKNYRRSNAIRKDLIDDKIQRSSWPSVPKFNCMYFTRLKTSIGFKK